MGRKAGLLVEQLQGYLYEPFFVILDRSPMTQKQQNAAVNSDLLVPNFPFHFANDDLDRSCVLYRRPFPYLNHPTVR